MAKYFVEREFQKCTPACHLSDMDPAFMDMLDRVRELAGIPLVLNSAYRSKAWEKAHGRPGTSTHCKGQAVDIRCSSDASRYRVFYGLFNGKSVLDSAGVRTVDSIVFIDMDVEGLADGFAVSVLS